MEVNRNLNRNSNGWTPTRIGLHADVIAGGTPSTLVKSYWGGDIKWMASGELHKKRVYDVLGRITRAGLENSSARMIPVNSVLVGLAGQGKTRGTVAISNTELCTNQSIAAILPTPTIDPVFLYHNLDSRYDELRSLSTGEGGRGGLNLTIIKNLTIALPPHSEQTAIAMALSDMDALITSLEKLIAKKRNIKQGVMQELLRPKEGWVSKTLEELLAKCQLGGNYRNNEEQTSYPLIKMGNLQRGSISTSKLEYVHESPFKQDRLSFGDVLFNTRNTLDLVGKVAIWRDELPEAYFNSNIMRLAFKPEYISSNFFMNYSFNTQTMLKRLRDIATGTTSVAAIYTRDLLKVELFVPNKDEQTLIGETLSSLEKEIDLLEIKLLKLKHLKTGMMQSLLSGKIRLV